MEREMQRVQPRDILREMQEKGLIGGAVSLENLLREKR
jgi:hypothetical protein